MPETRAKRRPRLHFPTGNSSAPTLTHTALNVHLPLYMISNLFSVRHDHEIVKKLGQPFPFSFWQPEEIMALLGSSLKALFVPRDSPGKQYQGSPKATRLFHGHLPGHIDRNLSSADSLVHILQTSWENITDRTERKDQAHCWYPSNPSGPWPAWQPSWRHLESNGIVISTPSLQKH